jgi:hypothetical protein
MVRHTFARLVGFGRSSHKTGGRSRRSEVSRRRLFERLEARSLLACDVSVIDRDGDGLADILAIIGDAQDNEIAIVASDNGTTIRCDGFATSMDRYEETFLVDTGRGNDRVRASVTVPAQNLDANGLFDLSVLPGSGNNEVEVDVRSEVVDPNNPPVVYARWTSHDPPLADPSADAAPAKLDVMFRPGENESTTGQVKLLGSMGRDNFRVEIEGLTCAVTANLRGGDDRLAVDAVMAGNLDLSVEPGIGDNEVRLSWREKADVEGLLALGALWTSHDPPLADPSADAAPAELDVTFRPGENESTSGQIKLLGSPGRDELLIDVILSPQSLDLDVDINLRGGNDRADFGWMMERQPRPSELPMIDAMISIDGGRGDDTIRADLNLAPAQGSLNVLVAGGRGDDQLTLRRRGIQTEDHLDMIGIIDGGPGRDRGRESKGVEIIHCEHAQIWDEPLDSEGVIPASEHAAARVAIGWAQRI